MDKMTLHAVTDSAGDATATGHVGPRRLYAIGWDGTELGGDATLTLAASVPLAGSVTLLALADAQVSGLYYPRVPETDGDGADLETTAMQVIDGGVTLTIAAGGDTNEATCTLYLV